MQGLIILPFKIIIHSKYATEELMKKLATTKLCLHAEVGMQSGASIASNTRPLKLIETILLYYPFLYIS